MTPTSGRPHAQAREHLVPHFTTRRGWYELDFPIVERGEGAYVWAEDGRRYLDGLSGLFCVNLGHGRRDLVDAATAQMGKLAYTSSWGLTHVAAIEAAEAIAGIAPEGLDEVFFVSSGSEAVESALKLARCYHLARGEEQRSKVIARDWAYHGTTLGALSVTAIPKMRDPFAPMLWPGVRHVPNTRGTTTSLATTDDQAQAGAEAIEEAIVAEGPETVSMVIAEPVQNGGGALVPPPGYWHSLRAICDRHGVLLCADEVICGFGRLGHWFGSERVGGAPDLMTFAKAATSAYAPFGGVIVRNDMVRTIEESPLGGFMHGATFGGHPVSAAVATATIQAMTAEKVLDNVRHHEDHLTQGLAALVAAHDSVAEVRGCGYFYAIELTGSRARGRPLTTAESSTLLGGLLSTWVWDAGLLIRPDDRGATMLVIAPPAVCGPAELDDLLDRLSQVLGRVDDFVGSQPADR